MAISSCLPGVTAVAYRGYSIGRVPAGPESPRSRISR